MRLGVDRPRLKLTNKVQDRRALLRWGRRKQPDKLCGAGADECRGSLMLLRRAGQVGKLSYQPALLLQLPQLT